MPRHNAWGQPIGPALPSFRVPSAPARVVSAGRYCRLEPLDPERHGPALFEALAEDDEPTRWTYLPYGPFETFASYETWLRQCCTQDDPLFFTIVDQESDRPLGVAAYLRITPQSAAIEVGHLNYAARLQRTPAATEAMYLMMKTAFELGYRRYEWKCDTYNQPSRAAAQRLGFSFEGVFRQATVYKDRSRDTAWYACIDAEWPTLERALTTWLDPANFDASGQQRRRLSDLTAPILVKRG
jgi:RimJ/RimL family protein N-acetyltransferase